METNVCQNGERVNLLSPWARYANKLRAMFGHDPDIEIGFNNDDATVTVYVSNQLKAEALARLLPVTKTFGNVEMKIIVIPENKDEDYKSLLLTALAGNPVLHSIIGGRTEFDMQYAVFAKEVVQYYDDNLGDPNGLTSTLYQDLAKDLFENVKGIYFTTDPEDKCCCG